MAIHAGLISLGGYLPAKRIAKDQKGRLVSFLKRETLLRPEYIDHIHDTVAVLERKLRLKTRLTTRA